jgi:hypothetical protein
MCGLVVSLKFLQRRGVGSSACSTLFFAAGAKQHYFLRALSVGRVRTLDS